MIIIGYIKHPNEYIENEDYIILRVTSDKYGTFDYEIDKDDFEKVKQRHWGISATKSNKKKYIAYYAHSNGILLHRYLMNSPEGYTIDHKDGSEFNNRKSNLRKCTQKENGKNRKKNKNNKSGVKGVFWNTHAPTPKWQAFIMVNYYHKSLGYYEDFKDAVRARKAAEIEYFGEYNRKIDDIL